MNTKETRRRAAADARFIKLQLARTEHRGEPGCFLTLEPRRGRAHLVIHHGRGPDTGWSSCTMDAVSFQRFQTGVLDLYLPTKPKPKGGA